MTKKILSTFGVLLALCWTFSVSAQTLLFDAAGTGTSFTKVGGTNDYALSLNGNSVVDGKVTIGNASGIGIAVNTDLLNGTGVTVMIDVEGVPSTLAPLVELTQSGVAGPFGIWRQPAGTPQGYWVNNTYDSADGVVAGAIDNSGVFSLAYKGVNEAGVKGTKGYFNGTQVYYKSGLVFTTPDQKITHVLIGQKTQGTTLALSTGMKVKRIHVYEGQLTTSQIATAEVAIKTPIVATPLELAITAAKLTYTSTKSGINPGQYNVADRQVLQQAITTAEEVKTTNPEESVATAAIAALNAAVEAYLTKANSLTVSTSTDVTWYYLKAPRGSTATALYAQDMGDNLQILNKDKGTGDAQLWKLVAHSSGTGVAIVSKEGRYLEAKVPGASAQNLNAVAAEPAVGFNTKENGLNSDGVKMYLIEDFASPVTFRLHAGAGGNNYGLVNWTGSAADNCSFTFMAYSPSGVLTDAIAAAYSILNNAQKGDAPGLFTEANIATFRAAIEAAEVYNGGDATPEEKATYATTTLKAAEDAFVASRNPIKLSTEGNETWYYITGVMTYANGKVIVASGTTDGSNYNFTDKSLNPTKLFKFEDAGSGKVSIKNMGTGLYIGGDAKAKTVAAAFNANYLGSGQYSFSVAGSNPLHAQENGKLLVTWAGGLNSASAWKMEELPAEDVTKPVAIASVAVGQGFVSTGKGNIDHPLMYANVSVDGLVGTAVTKGIKLDFSESNHLASIKKVKVYKMPMGDKRLKVANATLVGEADITDNEVQINFSENQTLVAGINRFGIAVDVAEDAVEGKLIKAKVVDITLADDSKKSVDASPAHACTIFLTQSLVIAPGDYGSVSYRIPAIVVANDSALVVVTDKRKNHSGDLAADIDLTVQRSIDNGKTWSEPIIIAGADTNIGYGDAAIVKDRETGKLIVVCVSDKSFWGSTPTAPIRLIYFESLDNGLTWSAPRDITSQIWGAGCSNPITAAWNGMFPASGRMLQLRSGRIMSAMLVRNPVTGGNDNFVMYTDDLGATWHPSTSMAVKGGDEAKLTQRNDGKVIISSRQGGGRVWNVSNNDGGIEWTQSAQKKRPELFDQNCNGEIMTYTSTLDGYDKNRMLHSLCWNSGNRQNVSMLISYDEGETWGHRKTICAPSSAYSTFDILPDGTIGMYYEDGTHGGEAFEMVFVRFSVDWLTDGEDTFVPLVNSVEKNPSEQIKVSVSNGKIVVYGTEELPRVFSISGVELNKDAVLTSGVYLVKVAGQTAKVAVN